MKPTDRLPALFDIMNKKQEEISQQQRLERRDQEDARVRQATKHRRFWWQKEEG